MSSKKVDPANKLRIQVPASQEQAKILAAAAEAAGCADRATWMLAHSLKAAGAKPTAGAPVVISGEVADQLRAQAKRQGVSTDQVLAQLLIAI